MHAKKKLKMAKPLEATRPLKAPQTPKFFESIKAGKHISQGIKIKSK
jgi:hypothetical protein